MTTHTVKVHESQLETYIATKVWNDKYTKEKEWEFYSVTIYLKKSS